MGLNEMLSSWEVKLKTVYSELEGKYYNFLDKVNEKVPIYSIVDPIDKIVPSFALLLAIIFVLILGLVMSAFPTASSQAHDLTFSIVDSEDSPLSGVNVKLILGENSFDALTDSTGEALFTDISPNTTLSFKVERAGFKKVESEVLIENDDLIRRIVLENERPGELKKTILLRNSRGQPVADALISFSCSNPLAKQLDSQKSDFSGKLELEVPQNCGKLTFSVRASNYKNLDSIFLEQDNFIVSLEAEEGVVGNLRVNVSYQGDPVDSIKVKMYRKFEQELGPIEEKFTANGLVVFEKVFPGEYVIKTESTDVYSNVESDQVSVRAGEDTRIELSVVKNIVGKVNVRLTDQSSRKAVSSAKVRLFKYEEEIASSFSNEDGLVEFSVTDRTGFRIIVDHEDYLVKLVDNLEVTNTPSEILLEKFTGQNGGILRVKVVDEKGFSVVNSKVTLFDTDSNRLAEYSSKTTDINGQVEFTRVQNGNFKAFSYKASTTGYSDSFTFDRRTAAQKNVKIVMQIPLSKVNVNVMDEENNPVSFARVSVFDSYNNEIVGSNLTNPKGTISFQIQADKKVYVQVEKDGATFYSVEKQVIPESIVLFNTVLPKRLKLDQIRVNFVGLYQKGEEISSIVPNVAAGEEYVARFQIQVPENNFYGKMGLHVRTGDSLIMEKDLSFIKAINFPNTRLIRATSFDEGAGYDRDVEKVSFNESKWVDFTLLAPTTGVYEAEVTIKVKENATLDDKIKIYYRAWAEEASARDRDPEDTTIDGDDLYDNVKEQQYQVGIPTLCDDSFCFDAQVFDLEEKIVKKTNDSYEARVFSPYNLKFNLLNSSKTAIHNNAFMRIYNPEKTILFKEYELGTAESGKIKGDLSKHRFNDYDVGRFTPNKRIIGEMNFFVEASGTSTIVIQLVSDNKIVYEKVIAINAIGANDFTIEIEPRELASGVETKGLFVIKDSASTLGVENAQLTIRDKAEVIIDHGFTNRQGELTLDIPAQMPAETLFIKVEKSNYNTLEESYKVQENVLSTDPEKLAFSVNPKTKLEERKMFKVKNSSGFAIKIEDIEVIGNLRGLIDEDDFKNFMAQYVGTIIESNEEKEFYARVSMSEEAKAILKRTDLSGIIIIRASNFGMSWSTQVPYSVSVGVGPELDNTDCLIVSKKEWNNSSEGQPIRTEFSIRNNCVIENTPVTVFDLSAKFKTTSNMLGTYQLEISKDGVRESNLEVRDSYFKKLITEMNPDSVYNVTITFTPSGGVLGVAKGDVLFRAANRTDSGDQFVEVPLKTELAVVNILECISFSKDTLYLGETGKSAFSVETKECGGKTKFELESKLDLSLKEFSLGAKEKSPEIEVLAGKNYAGQYPIYVKVKPEHSKTFRELKMVKVRVEPKGCFSLNRYEFDVKDSPDNAELINECYDKHLKVKVSLKSWTDAMQVGAIAGIAAFATVGLGNLASGKSFFGSDSNATSTATGELATDAACSGQKDSAAASGTCKPTAQCASADNITPNTEATAAQTCGNGLVCCYSATGAGARAPATGSLAADAACSGLRGNVEATGVCKTMQQCSDKDNKITPVSTAAADQKCETGYVCCATTLECKGICIKDEAKRVSTLDNSLAVVVGIANDSFNENTCQDSSFKCVPDKGKINCVLMYTEEQMNKGEGDRVSIGSTYKFEVGKFNYQFTCTYSPERGIGGILEKVISVATAPKPNNSEPITALVALPSTTRVTPISGFAAAGGAASSALGSVSTLQQTLLGSSNPMISFGLGFIGGTLGAYFSQKDEKELSTVAWRIKLNPSSFTMLGEKGNDDNANGTISVLVTGNSITPRQSDVQLHNQEMGLKFTKEKDFNGEIFRILKISTEEYLYDTSQVYGGDSEWDSVKKKVPKQDDLEQRDDSPVKADYKFHLQFNSIPNEEQLGPDPELPPLDCEFLGGGTGATGSRALPRVKYEWEWPTIDTDTCDKGNENYIYCDATQFSIEILRKVQGLRDFLEENQLDCPRADKGTSTRTNVIPPDDIGLSLVRADRKGKDVNVVVEIYNNNQQKINATLNVIARNKRTGTEKTCEKQIKTVTKRRIGCEFKNLTEDEYDLEVTLTPDITSCETCFNNILSDDKISTTFSVGTSGYLTDCKPFKTERLLDFVDTSMQNGRSLDFSSVGGSRDTLAEYINFRAHLVEDQYSKDFQKDFDEYSKTKSFFSAPQFYTKEFGLSEFFKNSEKFKFENKFGGEEPIGLKVQAGLYSVLIDVEFEDDTWDFYKGDATNAIIHVKMQKDTVPVPDSPFYYMPFNGLIGEENERTNYGINYEGNLVKVNNNNNYIVKTLNMPSSITQRTLKVEETESFKRINVLNRGRILTLTKGNDIRMVYSPSYATPVLMQVKNSTQDAFSFYSIGVNNSTEQSNVGSEMLLWSGIGLSCKDFFDRDMVDSYDETADVHAIDSQRVQCARVAPNKDIAYGLEWCGRLIKSGDVTLKTVVFTPQGTQSSMQLESFSDSATLITQSDNGTNVPLNGISGMPRNSYGSDGITSIQDIFDLVEERYVCVAGTGARTEFVWNPKRIVEHIKSQEDTAVAACIN